MECVEGYEMSVGQPLHKPELPKSCYRLRRESVSGRGAGVGWCI